jgi:CBS domain-containing protein
MPISVSSLLPNRPAPVHVRADENLHVALALLLDNDFSQLPVVEGDRPIGMVTKGSILQTLRHLCSSLDKLSVVDAVAPKHAWACVGSEADLGEVLAHLETLSAVLVTDEAGKLTHILTPWDMSEFFRLRSEDFMLVRDVETTLKDFLRAAFEDPTGRLDDAGLNQAVPPEPRGPETYRTPFRRALAAYLQDGTPLDDARTKVLEAKHFAPKPRTFEKITFGDYVQMFTDETRWEAVFAPVFGPKRKEIRLLLEDVNRYRNSLAHFQVEVLPPDQQERLRFAAEWMQRHFDRFQRGRASAHLASAPPGPAPRPDGDATPGYEEGIDPTEGRYARLGAYLRAVQGTDRVELSFETLADILQGPLPASALRHRAWWANQADGHSSVWLDAGWRTGTLNLSDRHVAFVRIAEQGRAYLEFFVNLSARLRNTPGFPMSGRLPLGTSWHNFGSVAPGVVLAAAFTTRSRVRAELYIDTGDQTKNKLLFDKVAAHSDQIQHTTKFPVTFERLDDKRASRIAMYLTGRITEKRERLVVMEETLAAALVALHGAVGPYFS